MDALSNYTSLLQDAQKRMSIFRHDSRHQLRLLSELIGQYDDKATLPSWRPSTQNFPRHSCSSGPRTKPSTRPSHRAWKD